MNDSDALHVSNSVALLQFWKKQHQTRGGMSFATFLFEAIDVS